MSDTIIQYDAVTIILPSDLLFENQSEFTPILQSIELSLDGIAVIEEFVKTNGLSIILSGDSNRSWIIKSTLTQLLALEAIPGKVITLTLSNSQTFTVMLDRSDGKAIEYREIFDVFPTVDDSLFWIRIKFVTL